MNTAVMEKPAKIAKNGVDVPTLLATIGAVKEMPVAAKFQFRAKGAWVSGTHSRATVNGFFGAGEEQNRDEDFVIEGDHPAVVCGADKAPTPVEYLLSALAACLTAGVGNIASVRQIDLESVETIVEGDIDMQGILGLNDEVRNGFEGIRATVKIKGNAPAEQLEKVVQQSIARSAVFDMLSNGTKVDVAIAA
ncbi:putative OsmC-like protein [Aliiruegeria haliotis]|uniref:Putative OsmC-like protein n=1 Tax=Aliiruegeria haliotis TaxID=1280846 RepID=A0A2T0RYX9_9RHOB|nr:OsmC family protein [Aliiruegeria haliotis]PRY26396.1 putative OsmC-like protein [Aliiruegeria haliotis]